MVKTRRVHQSRSELPFLPLVAHFSSPELTQQVGHQEGQSEVLVLVDKADVTESVLGVVPADGAMAY